VLAIRSSIARGAVTIPACAAHDVPRLSAFSIVVSISGCTVAWKRS
jgi:hypothetical protein